MLLYEYCWWNFDVEIKTSGDTKGFAVGLHNSILKDSVVS